MPLPKGQKIRSKQERRRIALEVWSARLRGLSISEIGRLKNLPDSTVWTFLQEAQRLNRAELSQLTQEEIKREFWLEGKDRIKNFWIIFSGHRDDPAIQLRCLEGIGAEAERMIKTGQSLGLIRKEPDTINIKLAAEVITYAVIDTITDLDTRNRLAAAISKRLAALGFGGDPDRQPELPGSDGH